MSEGEPKKKLVGPWQSLHLVIWLIGLYLLATRNWWWPGILVLLAISAIYEALLRQFVPGAYVEEKTAPTSQGTLPIPSATPLPLYKPATVQEHRIDLLPQVCPSCNAPIRGHEVKWTGVQSANCPYCGTNLPMNKI
jgi:hypothetical protein